MDEDYFDENKITIFENKQSIFLDYNDWGELLNDVYTLILYKNVKCLQKYKDQLYYIISLMKLNDFTNYTYKNAVYIDDYLLLIYDLYEECGKYAYDLHKNIKLNFINPFEKYNEFIINDEIKMYEHLLYLTHLNTQLEYKQIRSYYSTLKYIDYCLDNLNIEKQNISNYNTYFKKISERYVNFYNIVVKKQFYLNCEFNKNINYFDDNINIYDILIYIINKNTDIKEVKNIKLYYVSKIKTEENILLIQRYNNIIQVCDERINNKNKIVDDLMN